MAGLRASLAIIIASAVFAGIAFEISWKVGLPVALVACAVTFWCTAIVKEIQRERATVPDTALVYFTALLSLCAVTSVLGSLYLPHIVITLNAVILASMPAHFFLLEKQWHKMSQYLHIVLGESATITTVGIITTGLCFNIGWAAIVPGAVLLIYSALVLGFALFDSRMIQTNSFATTGMVIVLVSTFASFITYHIAPFWCPVAVVAAFTAVCFLVVAEGHVAGLHANHGSLNAVLQLVAAAAAGVAIAMKMPPAWIIVTLVGMLPGTVIIGERLYRIQREELTRGRTVHIFKCPRVLVTSIVFILGLLAFLTITFYFAFESLSMWIPVIFVCITVLRTLVVYYVIFDCRAHYKFIGGAAAFLSLATLYLFFVVLLMVQPTPLVGDATLYEHLIALFVAGTLTFHCVLTFWCEWRHSPELSPPTGSPQPAEEAGRDDESNYEYEEIGGDDDRRMIV